MFHFVKLENNDNTASNISMKSAPVDNIESQNTVVVYWAILEWIDNLKDQ